MSTYDCRQDPGNWREQARRLRQRWVDGVIGQAVGFHSITRQGIWGCKAIRWSEKQLKGRSVNSFRSCCYGMSSSEWRVRVNFWRVHRSLGLQVDWSSPRCSQKESPWQGTKTSSSCTWPIILHAHYCCRPSASRTIRRQSTL